jgi:hypothetical protein
MKDGDVATAMLLTDDPCIVSGPQGVASVDKQTLETMFKAGPTLKDFQFKQGAKMRKLSDDVAVLAYEVREELTVDGQPVTIEAAECSTWIRRDGRWACAQHSEAIEGDPFGRDRGPRREEYAGFSD